ncbi:alpha/beta hydrolase family protein [Sphingomonas profundi]|uniref:alpha/beta hydrolase family protein n=1 Tax=Alterirhizorhabdus profundi TaxID=2681549 RepID=UPI0012E8A02F|nr:alpha/beta fold hydrolase [Sphingomonas profundi]
MTRAFLPIAAIAALLAPPAPARPVPAAPPAIAGDPPRDAAHPARMEVLHVPSGGGTLNAVAYLAAGPGPHPTLVLFHGLPGNEKNGDLAQAVRRAGWNVVLPNYRGSWGSSGRFSFAGNLVDADAVLAYVRDPDHAARLGIDPARLAIAGHSMGGWVTALTAAHDHRLLGAALISAANMGPAGRTPRAELVARMADNRETLAASAEQMADELAANAALFDWTKAAPALAARPLLVLTSDDGLAPAAADLAAAVRAGGGRAVTLVHVATDHSWSDARLRLANEIVAWLQALPPAR